MFVRFVIMCDFTCFSCIIFIFIALYTHVRLSYVLLTYLLTYLVGRWFECCSEPFRRTPSTSVCQVEAVLSTSADVTAASSAGFRNVSQSAWSKKVCSCLSWNDLPSSVQISYVAGVVTWPRTSTDVTTQTNIRPQCVIVCWADISPLSSLQCSDDIGWTRHDTIRYDTTGPPTRSVGGADYSNSHWCLSSSSVTLHGGPAGGFTRASQAMTSCRLQSNYSSTVTLHGGPVVLRPVRATPCFTLHDSDKNAILRYEYLWCAKLMMNC